MFFSCSGLLLINVVYPPFENKYWELKAPKILIKFADYIKNVYYYFLFCIILGKIFFIIECIKFSYYRQTNGYKP